MHCECSVLGFGMPVASDADPKERHSPPERGPGGTRSGTTTRRRWPRPGCEHSAASKASPMSVRPLMDLAASSTPGAAAQVDRAAPRGARRMMVASTGTASPAGRGQEQRDPRGPGALRQPRRHGPHRHHGRHARQRDRAQARIPRASGRPSTRAIWRDRRQAPPLRAVDLSAEWDGYAALHGRPGHPRTRARGPQDRRTAHLQRAGPEELLGGLENACTTYAISHRRGPVQGSLLPDERRHRHRRSLRTDGGTHGAGCAAASARGNPASARLETILPDLHRAMT